MAPAGVPRRHSDDDVPPRPGDDVPPRPEEEVADAGKPAASVDDEAARPGAPETAPFGPGHPPRYPPSPRPPEGPITSPTPEIADPDYRLPDYPTEPTDEDGKEDCKEG